MIQSLSVSPGPSGALLLLLNAMNEAMKVCVKWDDFQKAVTSAFESLSGNTEFSDVTLVCDDGQQVEAHRVIRPVRVYIHHHRVTCSSVRPCHLGLGI